MQLLEIQEYALSTAVEYRQPVLFRDADLDKVAGALAGPPCGTYLNPTDISLTKQDELFSYAMSAPLFNGAASISINARGITVAFKHGRTMEDLDLMKKLTLAALAAGRGTREVKSSLFSFTAHATFESAAEFEHHMKQFTGLGANVESGGLIMVMDIPQVRAKLRYASEKSLTHSNALFFAATALCEHDVSEELFDILAERFKTVAGFDKVAFKNTPPRSSP